MQKALAICFALLLVVSMVGCNSKNNELPTEMPSTKETQNLSAVTPETYKADAESITEDFTDSNAVYMCRFVQSCLGEPDSFQIHGVSHIEEDGHHFYYLDFSHEIKNKEMERTYYFAEFDSSTLLCIVNEKSAIYYQTDGDYTTKYPVLSSMFQEQNSEQLDIELVVSDLE